MSVIATAETVSTASDQAPRNVACTRRPRPCRRRSRIRRPRRRPRRASRTRARTGVRWVVQPVLFAGVSRSPSGRPLAGPVAPGSTVVAAHSDGGQHEPVGAAVVAAPRRRPESARCLGRGRSPGPRTPESRPARAPPVKKTSQPVMASRPRAPCSPASPAEPRGGAHRQQHRDAGQRTRRDRAVNRARRQPAERPPHRTAADISSASDPRRRAAVIVLLPGAGMGDEFTACRALHPERIRPP